MKWEEVRTVYPNKTILLKEASNKIENDSNIISKNPVRYILNPDYLEQ